MQAHLVTAPGDGVAPAVLLSLPASGGTSAAAASRQPPAQYLFNVPEGFARLVLEHKLRPGAHLAFGILTKCVLLPAAAATRDRRSSLFLAGAGLRAAFAPDPAALAGFGGLVMRLRGEGHAQLHVVGPPGAPLRCILSVQLAWCGSPPQPPLAPCLEAACLQPCACRLPTLHA